MPWPELIMGLIIGFVGGYAGIGGAPFLIFLLATFVGYSQHEAQGTVLAMMLGPITVFSVIAGWNWVRPRLREIGVCVVAYMIFSYLGAEVAYLLQSDSLSFLFSMVLMMLGLLYILRNPATTGSGKPRLPFSLPWIFAAGAAVGIFGGILGIGAGVLLIPILTSAFGRGQHEARAMALAILMPPVSLGAVIKYGLFEQDVRWLVALAMMLAYMSSNGAGAILGNRGHPRTLRTALGSLLLLAGLLMIINSIRSGKLPFI